MYAGARVTDAVDFFDRRGETRGAVRIVRTRVPERFRWRSAVGSLTAKAGGLRGLDRMRIEEPIREVVVDLPDQELRRELVLDARRNGLDLDRGEVLPGRTVGELRRFSFLTGTDIEKVCRYVHVPDDFFALVDTAAVVLVGRAYADAHRKRAQHLWLRLPDPENPVPLRLHERLMSERARKDAQLAERWTAFARAVCETGMSEVPEELSAAIRVPSLRVPRASVNDANPPKQAVGEVGSEPVAATPETASGAEVGSASLTPAEEGPCASVTQVDETPSAQRGPADGKSAADSSIAGEARDAPVAGEGTLAGEGTSPEPSVAVPSDVVVAETKTEQSAVAAAAVLPPGKPAARPTKPPPPPVISETRSFSPRITSGAKPPPLPARRGGSRVKPPPPPRVGAKPPLPSGRRRGATPPPLPPAARKAGTPPPLPRTKRS